MIRIAPPQILEFDFEKIKELNTDSEKRNYVINQSSFRVKDCRVGNIELIVTCLEGQKPENLMIYYFQQIGKSQVEPHYSPFEQNDKIQFRDEESDYLKSNPLYADKIGVLARGNGNCKLIVEAFRVL